MGPNQGWTILFFFFFPLKVKPPLETKPTSTLDSDPVGISGTSTDQRVE